MTAPARLTGLRVLGFKSFAEKTTVEFGPGISAVIGPNGSGKSNLADALRWTLGEAGRSLRTRRAEDVIFAGSSARRATGMADVTLLLDNRDQLLPVAFGELEVGRRLFRSGENEYLLNRQRIRLRDLIDLLDAGNLADNAFLFIGQGMVDQALALRPEERRPLFEEAAGVRRHERRRRQAETELTEAEANLERLRDVLAELRPQARRLAAQAEQLVARRSAGHDLAEALVDVARARWHELSTTANADRDALAAAHSQADAALADLRTAEDEGQALARALAERAEREATQRIVLDRQRSAVVELRLALARAKSDQDSIGRDRARIGAERRELANRTKAAEADLGRPLPAVDVGLADELAGLKSELEQIDTYGSTATPSIDLSALERRRAALAVQLDELRSDLSLDQKAMAAADLARAEAAAAEARIREEFESARERTTAARADAERATVEESRSVRADADARSVLAGLQARLAAAERSIDNASHAALGRAVRARGGALAAEGLETDPTFRHAVAAALGDTAQAWLVSADSVGGLPRDGGTLVLRSSASQGTAGSVAERQLALAEAVGGGALLAAIRRDPQGELTRLLARTLWVPRLEDALRIREGLAAGWQVVTIEGQLLTDHGVVRLAASDRFLSAREELDEVRLQLADAERVVRAGAAALKAAGADRARLVAAADAARRALDEARRDLSIAEEVARTTHRRADNIARDHSLHRARLAGLETEAVDIDRRIAAVVSQPTTQPADMPAHRTELVRRRDELAGRLAAQEHSQRGAADARQRAEVTLAMADERGRQLDDESESLAGREATLAGQSERLESELASAIEAESSASTELERVMGDAQLERQRLAATESAASSARERLRDAEARSRQAEVAAMEAVLRLDSQREQLLVELAGIGPDAIAPLTGDDDTGGERPVDAADLGDLLAVSLDKAIERWGSATAKPADAPGAGKLASLRRRFHELGAGNPFAATEYAEARNRLETMDGQARDLEVAISSTRKLIADLNELIATQFRSTFAALEDAFARRFKQLFDGGEAELSLTAPEDLAATGIEIMARPPGKKRQPLQMLSGGERALTAVALLLAMLEVRPVPFCVLDEVDAALDEANIYRFAQALRGLADKTQFIVITHNRGTIEMADALYGVTIGPDAVSRIVSLRLPAPAEGNGRDADRGSLEETTEVLA